MNSDTLPYEFLFVCCCLATVFLFFTEVGDYEVKKNARFLQENECRPYKYERATGLTHYRCNEGIEITR